MIVMGFICIMLLFSSWTLCRWCHLMKSWGTLHMKHWLGALQFPQEQLLCLLSLETPEFCVLSNTLVTFSFCNSGGLVTGAGVDWKNLNAMNSAKCDRKSPCKYRGGSIKVIISLFMGTSLYILKSIIGDQMLPSNGYFFFQVELHEMIIRFVAWCVLCTHLYFHA